MAAHGIDPNIEIYGVEPEAGNDFKQSLERGEPVRIGVPKTIADGLQTTSPGVVTFAIAQRHTRAIVTVTDDELRDAVRFAFSRLKLVIEPSGAAAIAALMQGRIPQIAGKRVGAIVSGGNVDPAHFASLL